MRIVVTGATGNVGSRLVQRLASDDAVDHVLGVSRREPPDVPAGVDWRPVDLGEDVPTDLLRGADAVIHLAWLFQPTRDPATTWRANVEGTARLLTAVAEARVPTFLQASSVGAYSPAPDHPVDESWPTHGMPTAAYSREKAYVERMLDSFEQRRPSTRVVRLRPGFIFRRESAVQQRRLFGGPFAPATLMARIGLPLVPDLRVSFQVVHTDDAVEAYRLALLGDVRGAFNIATDPVLTMREVAQVLGARTFPVPRRVTRVAVGAAWAAHLVPASPGLFDMLAALPIMRTDRARDELGWQPRFGGRATFRELWDGLRSGTGAPTPPLDPRTSGGLRSQELKSGIGHQP